MVLKRMTEKQMDWIITPFTWFCCKGKVAITAEPSPFGIIMEIVALSSKGEFFPITNFTAKIRITNKTSVIPAPQSSQSRRLIWILSPMKTKKKVRRKNTSSLKKSFSSCGRTILWLGIKFLSLNLECPCALIFSTKECVQCLLIKHWLSMKSRSLINKN